MLLVKLNQDFLFFEDASRPDSEYEQNENLVRVNLDTRIE
jgi:hypothetical protein